MNLRFFVLNNQHEVGIYKAPAELTARIMSESLGTEVEVFEDFEEARDVAADVFDRHIYECKKWGLPTDAIEQQLQDIQARGRGGSTVLPRLAAKTAQANRPA